MAKYSTGDSARGAALFEDSCSKCHALSSDNTGTKEGPSFFELKLFGRKIGQAEGFQYSDAFKAKKVSWDEQTCFEWLESPAKYIPGTKTKFDGLPAKKDRDDVVTYLKDVTK